MSEDNESTELITNGASVDVLPVIDDPHRMDILTLKPDGVEWITTSKGKEYFLATCEGERVRVFRSGVVWGETSKKMLSGSKDNRITTENTGYHSQLRKKNKMVQAIQEKFIKEGNGDEIAGLMKLIDRLFAIATDPNSDPKDVIAAHRELRMTYTAADVDMKDITPAASAEITNNVLEQILSMAVEYSSLQD